MQVIKSNSLKPSLNLILNNSSISGVIWRSAEIAALSEKAMKRPVLDLGCGDGRFTKIMFNERLDWGVDISEKEIEKARQKGSHIHYLVSAAHSIDLPSNSIQTVFSNSVFEHIPNLNGVLREISRILKPGGELVFTTHAPSSKNFFGAIFLRKLGLSPLAKFYEKVFVNQLQLATLWSRKRWEKELTKVDMQIENFEEMTTPLSAFWYEFFMPVTFIQNRVPIFKKIPLAKIVFLIIRPNLGSIKNGRNYFIRARKK